MEFFQFRVPTKVVFGVGLAKDFSAELESIAATKFLLVTDKVLSDLKVIDPIIEGINNAGREVVAIFKDVPADSGVPVVEACAALAKSSGAEGIIAVGGGSVLDTAKGANILFSLGGNLVDDYSGAQTITQDLAPLIAIPTTAGTGSEVTEAIVIKDPVNAVKLSFVDSHLLPTLTVLDPELTVGLPPKITAATAMDALTHAIESVMSIQRAPIPDALAKEAIKLIFENLLPAVQDGSNIEARSALLVASNMAGIAFNHSMVGVVHSVAHTIGALFHVHHGMANSIFLPYGMEYNLEARATEIASLAPSMGLVNSGDAVTVAQNCIDAVKKLKIQMKEACGLPLGYAEVGVKESDLTLIAEKSPEDGSSFYNPRELNAEDLLPYLKKALTGE